MTALDLNQIRGCTKCPRLGKNYSAATGSPKARVMFVTDHPFEKEEQEGESGRIASGAAGDLYTYIADQAGMDRDEFYFTSLIKCWSSSVPSIEEIKTCWSAFLANEIRAVRPEVIVCVGDMSWAMLVPEALDEETGKSGYVHGNFLRRGGINYLCCYSPLFFLSAHDMAPFVELGDTIRTLLQNPR